MLHWNVLGIVDYSTPAPDGNYPKHCYCQTYGPWQLSQGLNLFKPGLYCKVIYHYMIYHWEVGSRIVGN